MNTMSQEDRLKWFEQRIPFFIKTELKALALDPEQGVKVLMPLEPNKNHIGIMYAGALCTLAECVGGGVYTVYFKREGNFPIAKGMNIKFKRPAKTDVTCAYSMTPDASERIFKVFETNGKADYTVNLELKDAEGNVVAICEGFYQIRKGGSL